jgi:hypothetical protein
MEIGCLFVRPRKLSRSHTVPPSMSRRARYTAEADYGGLQRHLGDVPDNTQLDAMTALRMANGSLHVFVVGAGPKDLLVVAVVDVCQPVSLILSSWSARPSTAGGLAWTAAACGVSNRISVPAIAARACEGPLSPCRRLRSSLDERKDSECSGCRDWAAMRRS